MEDQLVEMNRQGGPLGRGGFRDLPERTDGSQRSEPGAQWMRGASTDANITQSGGTGHRLEGTGGMP
jgi:hypothetical protein